MAMWWDMVLWGRWVGLHEKINSLSLELTDFSQLSWQQTYFFMIFTLCTTFINENTYSFQLSWVAANIQITLVPMSLITKFWLNLYPFWDVRKYLQNYKPPWEKERICCWVGVQQFSVFRGYYHFRNYVFF